MPLNPTIIGHRERSLSAVQRFIPAIFKAGTNERNAVFRPDIVPARRFTAGRFAQIQSLCSYPAVIPVSICRGLIFCFFNDLIHMLASCYILGFWDLGYDIQTILDTINSFENAAAERVNHRLVFGFSFGIFLEHSEEQVDIQHVAATPPEECW